MGGTRSALALPPNDLDRSLIAAFATNDLQRICRAVDAGILQSTSIIAVAQAAQIDRRAVRSHVEAQFDIRVVAEKHLSLYTCMLREPR